MKQKTKEEFVAELAAVLKENKEWSDGDVSRRKTLSKMLGAPYKKRGTYDYSDEQEVYSWPEIYFALGKLIAKRDYADFTDTIQRHKRDIGDLRQ